MAHVDPQSEPKCLQLFVKSIEGHTITLDPQYKITQYTTIKQIKEILAERKGIQCSEVTLVYASKHFQEEDKDHLTVGDVGIQNGSTLFMGMRLHGGIELLVKLENREEIKLDVELNMTVKALKQLIYEKNKVLECTQMKLQLAGIVFSDDNQCLINLIPKKASSVTILQSKADLTDVPGLIISYDDDLMGMGDTGEANAVMNCGHVIARDSMTMFLQSLLDNNLYKIVCPGYNLDGEPCNTEWDYSVCRKIGVLTSEENKKFEEGLGKRLFFQLLDGKECPHCQSFIIKPSTLTSERVKCPSCKKPDFCWKCMRSWKGSEFDDCGNYQCKSKKEINRILASCPSKVIEYVEDVPSQRVCPNCESLIEHDEACRHMKCKSSKCRQAKYEFCFICLREWKCHNREMCSIAPRQALAE